MNAADLKPVLLDLLLVFALLQVLVLDLLMPHGRKKALGGLTALLLVGIFGVSFFIDTSGTAFFGAYQGGPWALFFKRIFLVGGALVCLGGVDYVDRYFPRRQGEYYVLLLASLLGMSLLPGARSLVLLVVCFELMGIPLAMLAAWAKTEDPTGPGRDAPEAALKLYLFSAVSTAITLFGLALIFGLAGTADLTQLSRVPGSPLLNLGLFMTLAGMGFKIGTVPFHMWVADTYQGAPLPFVGFLSVAPKAAGFAALALVFSLGLGTYWHVWAPAVVVLAVLSLVVGNLAALSQSNVKRLLAFSGIGQIGYMLMALVPGNSDGLAMLLFYLAGYTVTNIGAFLVVQAVAGDKDADLDDFDGLAKRSPILAFAMLLFMLSLAGIPFLVGFWAKFYVFLAAYNAGLGWLVFIAALFAVVGLYYYLKIIVRAYMRAPKTDAPIGVTPALGIAITICVLAVVLMGLMPSGVVDSALAASWSLLSPS